MNDFIIQLETAEDQRYRKKYPLIKQEYCRTKVRKSDEGKRFKLITSTKDFIGYGIVGFQNKGIGWILSFDENCIFDCDFFEKKIAIARKRRSHFFKSKKTNAFRLCNGEGDNLGGVTIDYYDGNLLIQWYSEGIYSYKEKILEALLRVVPSHSIYEKKRFGKAGKYIKGDDFVSGKRVQFPSIIKENNVLYSIHLNDGAMTGIFLDQREVRERIKNRYANSRTVLNTFSYTGAFSTAALAGNAKKTVSVDLANRSKELTEDNFIANNFDIGKEEIRVFDVFQYFPYAIKKNLKYDLIILDPPSFAKSKKHMFRAEKDYVKLLESTIQITANNGIIIASTNCAKFSMRRFMQFIKEAFSNQNKSYSILEKNTLPSDFSINPYFPEGNYLKVVFIQT